MVRKLIVLAAVLTLVGCANQSGLVVKIDQVGGDFWARKVGSNNQQVDTGQSTLSASTTGISGIPPAGLDWSSRMQTKASRIEITNVSGSVYFESAGSDNQGIAIPDILEKVYVPGDPFATTNDTTFDDLVYKTRKLAPITITPIGAEQ